jgi:hypothetical protein
MSRNWKVTTESGNVYHLDLGKHWAMADTWAYGCTVQSFKSFHQDVVSTLKTWDDIHALPESDAPVVGERMFIFGPDTWRLSSEVVDIEEIEG